MKQTELEDISEVSQQLRNIRDERKDSEDLSTNLLSSRDTKATSAFFIQQVTKF